MQQIAFLSLDPVQEEYAREIASDYGLDLQVVFPQEPAHFGPYAAVVCDLDCWPPDGQDQWLSDLRKDRPSCPVAVFSYHLNEKRAAALRRQGIAVFRGLSPKVFSNLNRQPSRLSRGIVGVAPKGKGPRVHGPLAVSRSSK